MRKLSFLILLSFCYAASFGQVFHNMSEFKVDGTLVKDSISLYSRLPLSLKGSVRDKLWALGQNTAGLSMRFATDATSITVRWTPLNKFSMNHMSSTGVRGFDLYVLMDDDTWHFAGSAIPSSKDTCTSTILKDMPKKWREYMLFFPLYDGVKSLEIGVNKGALIIPGEKNLPECGTPIVMYGTSIMQGGCASRPGMAHTNILQRMLNREIINLGFSGNAHLDIEIANLMAETDASAYVIDVLPNNTISSLKEKLEPFYMAIRSKRPDTPIVLVENALPPRSYFDPVYKNGIQQLNATLRAFYEKMVSQGDINVFYVEGTDILDPELEGTVDGIHFTDLGFQRFANVLYPLLNALTTN